MPTVRIRRRIDSYQVRGTGFVRGRQLRFHKRSHDGSAKADCYQTGVETDWVWGVLGEIDEAAKQALDRFEGLGAGYHLETVEVTTPQGPVQAIAYITDAVAVNPALRPYGWYKAYVLAGCQEHDLPAAYQEAIAAVPAWRDPDEVRRLAHAAVLKNIR